MLQTKPHQTPFALLILLTIPTLLQGADVRTLLEWTFDGDLQGWRATRHIEELSTSPTSISGRSTGHDPQLSSPLFEIPADAYQEVWARVKCTGSGEGQLFYSNTTEGKYGGFSGKKVVPFDVVGGDTWEIVRIRPWWQAEGKVIQIRFDLFQDTQFEVDWLRIVSPSRAQQPVSRADWRLSETEMSGWSGQGDILTGPPLRVPLQGQDWLRMTFDAPSESHIVVTWATDTGQGSPTRGVYIPGDTVPHTYSLNMAGHSSWNGNLLHLAIKAVGRDADTPTLRALSIASEPWPSPDIHLLYFGPVDSVNRVGQPCRFMARVANLGGKATNATARIGIQGKARLLKSDDAFDHPFTVKPELPVTAYATVSPTATGLVKAHLTLETPAGRREFTSAPMKVSPPVPASLPRGRIPEPVPARTDYLIGSYYYPGFGHERQWRQLERSAPWAKPTLGYYDEGNPECVDWQIKWAVEHGVGFFLIDWYWVAGKTHHMHYIDALRKARFRRYMKWAVMWANHNPPNTHSEEDWRNVTQFWIDEYFSMPEYLRVDGKPLVALWSPSNIRRDMGGSDGARALLDISQAMARDAGLPGIHFVAMNNNGTPEQLAGEGYQAWTSYHWWHRCRDEARDPRFYPFSLVAQNSRAGWDAREQPYKAAGMDFLPVVDTGWDARPRHGDNTFVIYERTPKLFRTILTEAKEWLDQRDEKLLIMGPWNEWTEGSYIEPCTEFGFSMLEAVRETFCEGPPPARITPQDVALGPYDFDLRRPGAKRTEWTFKTDDDAAAWRPLMGLADVHVTDGALVATTTTHDPAFRTGWLELEASAISSAEVTLSVSPAPTAMTT